jgi:hypothetical protein
VITVTDFDLGFPIWVRTTHWFNVLFVTLLMDSGLHLVDIMYLNRKKIARAAAFSALAIVAIGAGYLVLLCHPGFFFPYVFKRGEISLHSDEPIPPEPAGRILEEVERRLARSPLGTSSCRLALGGLH